MENIPNTLYSGILDRLDQVLSSVLENGARSDFYIRKYAKQISLPLASYEEFARLPLLHKEEISAAEPARHNYSAPEDIIFFGISSGTVSRNSPTIMPHSSIYRDNLRLATFNGVGHELSRKDRLMVLLAPTASKLQWFFNHPDKPCATNLGDVKNLPLSAKLAKEIGITALMTTPTILYYFLDELAKIDFDLRSIRWVNLTGEFSTEAKLEHFQSLLPECFFNQTYGSSEFGGGGIGYRCATLAKSEQNEFHPLPDVFVEILGENGGATRTDEPGKIVLTALTPRAFPMIRFQSNDFGCLRKSDCSCGNPFVLSLRGRADFDVLKFHGVVLRSEAIAESLKEISPLVEPVFQMHVFEEKKDDGLKPRLELHLTLKKEGSETPEMLALFRESVSSLLRLSPTVVLKDLVSQGFFLPLDIVIEKTWGEPQGKTRHIFSHLT